MARNIEIKARVKDVQAMQKRIERISGTHHVTLNQEDIFFYVPTGRLKLRIENYQGGQLIYYVREDIPGPKTSDYEIVKVLDSEGLKKVLAAALGIRGIVKKERKLYMHGNTRIQLDKIAEIGDFLELEVVQTEMRVKHDPETQAEELMKELGIMETDLLEGAYIDLLEKERG